MGYFVFAGLCVVIGERIGANALGISMTTWQHVQLQWALTLIVVAAGAIERGSESD